MTNYPRRPINVINCVDFYIYGISQQSSIPCNNSEGDCVWVGTFIPLVYNGAEPYTYDWHTDVGVINSGQDEELCEVWVTGEHPMDFNLTVTMTCPKGTYTQTVPFATKALPAKSQVILYD